MSLRPIADLAGAGNGGEVDPRVAARRRWVATAIAIAAVVVLAVIGGAFTPTFLTFNNLLVVIRQASITGVIALGMSYVTISGNLFALSAEELAILTACIFGWLMRAKFGLALSLIATLLFAGLGGAVQGGIIALGADPIITTLAFGGFFRGLASVVSQNQNILLGTDAAQWLGTGRPFGVPTQSWGFLILTPLAWIVLQKTRIGRVLLLTGANRAAARSAGLRVGQAALLGLTLLGLCCGLAGISAAAQFGQAVANLFQGLNFDVIAAVLVGGIALRGGQGSPIQAALGAAFIALLQNFMLLNDFSSGWRMTVVGSLVALATCLFHVLQRRRE
jgi:ribose transport system permease protein